MQNTRISYLYRDACNYKVNNDVVVTGVFIENEILDIIDTLDSGEFFVPCMIGFPETRFETKTEYDHPYFELRASGFEKTDAAPTISMSAKDVYAAFIETAGNW